MQQDDLRFNVFCLKIGIFYENVRRTQRRTTASVMLVVSVVAKLNMDFNNLKTTAILYDSQRTQANLHYLTKLHLQKRYSYLYQFDWRDLQN